TALRLASWAALRSKHTLACRRPSELSPLIQPMIQTPAHGSFPSGHGTEAFITATVLSSLLHKAGIADEDWHGQLMTLANRIAVNRTVAGVHYPVDSMAGCLLGRTLGRYFVARCTSQNSYRAWSFKGEAVAGNADFDFRKISNAIDHKPTAAIPGFMSDEGEQSDNGLGSPILAWLWKKALAEWTPPAESES
ncbi:MAG TPA: phosphatase PAP2 family protein, partial [Hyphomicrobiaceae bacterium]|nr:phosphatase PAP2 family protein [Hyphomicrobiaceae bacterium]